MQFARQQAEICRPMQRLKPLQLLCEESLYGSHS